MHCASVQCTGASVQQGKGCLLTNTVCRKRRHTKQPHAPEHCMAHVTGRTTCTGDAHQRPTCWEVCEAPVLRHTPTHTYSPCAGRHQPAMPARACCISWPMFRAHQAHLYPGFLPGWRHSPAQPPNTCSCTCCLPPAGVAGAPFAYMAGHSRHTPPVPGGGSGGNV